jgi:Beta-lactamase
VSRHQVGERFSYSNLGIDLVGYALELRSGKRFDEFMDEELFRPLGMTSSAFNNKVVANHQSVARGHTRDRILPAPWIHMIPSEGRYTSYSAGSMYSSVKDMARFISFHLAGGKIGGKQIIGENLLKEMYTQQFPIEGQLYGYGLGIVSAPLRSGTLLAHAGAGAGYRTYHMWTPEYQVGVVVLLNSESGDPQRIALGVFRQMIEAKYGPDSRTGSAKFADKPIITVDTKLLQRLAGTYQLREELLVAFKVKKDGLYVVSGTNEGRLNAHSPTEFSFRGSKFTFILDEKGRPKGVQVLSSSGYDSNVEFMPFNDSPDEEAGPNKKEWQDFVGEYSHEADGDTFNVSVMIKNGYLYLDRLGGLKLSEYKPGVFFTADGEAVIFQGARMSMFNYGYAKKSARKVE